jgi:hypothetical protein
LSTQIFTPPFYPPGQIRTLGSADNGDFVPDTTFGVIDQVQDFQNGILLTNNLNNTTERSRITFKPPKDRTWYLLKITVATQGWQAGTSGAVLKTSIDGKNIQGLDLNYTLNAQIFNIFGPNFGAGSGSSLPTDLIIQNGAPIRESISLSIQINTPNANPSSMILWIWIYEVQQTNPPPPSVVAVQFNPAVTSEDTWS